MSANGGGNNTVVGSVFIDVSNAISSIQRLARQFRGTNQQMNNLNRSSTRTAQGVQNMSNRMNQLNGRVVRVASGTQIMANQMNRVRSNANNAAQGLQNASQSANQAANNNNRLTQATRNSSGQLQNVGSNANRASQGLRQLTRASNQSASSSNQAANGISSFGDKLKNFSDKATAARDAYIKWVGGFAIGATALAKMSENNNLEFVKYGRQLDLIEERTKQHRENMEEINRSGVGEDQTSIIAAQKLIYTGNESHWEKAALKDPKETELKNTTKMLVANAEAMGVDVLQYITAVDRGKKNVLGNDTYEKSASWVNAMLKAFPDAKDEMLEGIAEYTNVLKINGITREEYIDSANLARDNGTFSAAQFLETMKEMTVQSTLDLSEGGEYHTGIQALWGYNKADETEKKQIDGKIIKYLSYLRSIKDDGSRNKEALTFLASEYEKVKVNNPMAAQELGVLLAGSQYEDNKGFWEAQMTELAHGTLGKGVVVNENSAKLNEKAIIDGKKIEATFRTIKQELIKNIADPIYKLFIKETLDKNGKVISTELQPAIKEGIKVLSDFLLKLGEIITKISEFADKNPEAYSALLKLVAGIGAIVVLLPSLVNVIKALSTIAGWLGIGGAAGGAGGIARMSITTLAKGGLWGILIASIIALVYVLTQKWDWFVKGWTDFFNKTGIADNLTKNLKALQTELDGAIDRFKTLTDLSNLKSPEGWKDLGNAAWETTGIYQVSKFAKWGYNEATGNNKEEPKTKVQMENNFNIVGQTKEETEWTFKNALNKVFD